MAARPTGIAATGAAMESWMRRSVPVVGSLLLALGAAQIVSQLATTWIDVQLGWRAEKAGWFDWPLVTGLTLLMSTFVSLQSNS